MDRTIRVKCNTAAQQNYGVAYICQSTLETLFEGDFYNKHFTACLKRRTPKSRRPCKDAIKLSIPGGFVRDGIGFELADGLMDSRILTYEADQVVLGAKLADKSYWVWLELDD